MEITREGFHWMIFYHFKKEFTQQEHLASLREFFSNKAPLKKIVYNWFAEFCRGRASVSDESREGQPKSIVIANKIDAVRIMIEKDRHDTHREIKSIPWHITDCHIFDFARTFSC